MGPSREGHQGRNRLSLPKFFSRVSDSIGPLLGGSDVREFLSSKSVLLVAPDDLDQHPFHLAGFLLSVNLCARLYPQLRIVAPPRVVDESNALALQINPICDFVVGDGSSDAALSWACPARGSKSIVVAPVGWEVLIDLPDATRVQSTNMLTSLASAAIGAAELFRQVFAEFLPKGRAGALPGRFNVLTHAPTSAKLPDLPPDIPLGHVHLVGAGAIGQAAVYALARVSATGTIIVVDPEVITSSNLQRYVLAMDSDVGTSKCAIVERTLKNKIETVSVAALWSVDRSETRNAEVICSAVDSEDIRIALQASLPRRVYNAWTQPDDIGWSRHEQFGVHPCVACLYWPTRERPSYHELIARAIRQHELRVLAYLSAKIPVDVPLQAVQIPRVQQYPVPPEASAWSERSLLDDVAVQLGVSGEDLRMWKGRLLPDLYREGICGGALVRKQMADVPVEMAVPLAHQSVLAGIMLATQLLVAARDDLKMYRTPAMESRLDLLAGFPQISARPRQRTPNCICSDVDFVERYRAKWPRATHKMASSPVTELNGVEAVAGSDPTVPSH